MTTEVRVLRGLALIGVSVVLAITGCSNVINEGGDTNCKTYLSQDDRKQTDAITKMLKDEGKSEPAELEISTARAAVTTYCKTLGNDDSKIKDAPHI